MIQKQKALADLGMEEIMDLKADEQQAYIEKAREDAERAGDKDRIAKIDQMLKDTDTRTSAERSEQHLEAIRSALTGETQEDMLKAAGIGKK